MWTQSTVAEENCELGYKEIFCAIHTVLLLGTNDKSKMLYSFASGHFIAKKTKRYFILLKIWRCGQKQTALAQGKERERMRKSDRETVGKRR